MKELKSNGSYYAEFCTQRFDTGAATDADSTPTATANKNGTDDGSFTLTVTKIDTGRYKVTGTVPNGYSAGDTVVISVAATVNSVAGKGVIDQFAVVSARPGIDDIPVEDVTLAASQGSYAPAKAGDAMTLTAAYDASKSAASQSSIDTIDGIADAIKAKTDNLPASPANEATLTTLHGHIDDILADTAEVQGDLANGGRLDLLVDAIKAKTDNLPASPANEATLTTLHGHIDDILADTAEVQGDLANGGRLDLLVDGIKAKTDNLPSDPADQSAVEAAISAAHATTDGKIDTVDGNVDSILADTAEIQGDLANGGRLDLLVDAIKAKTDNLPASPANEATLTTLHGHIDDILADTAEVQGDLANGGRLDLLIDGIKAKTDTNLDATVSSRLPTASYSAAPSAASIDTLLSQNHGAGAWGASAVGTIAYPDPINPFLDANDDPMVGVKIECFSNEARTALVDVQITDINGNWQFHLNAGEYWFRASLAQHESYEWSEELGGGEE